ncbi:MAG TPA: diguanylate cyclase [candidate division Zixibacteria bacterium]|nr:diguanylate cyclase [candidate division Zixibacteria bacterium]
MTDRVSRRDKLTGLPNLAAWTDALASERTRRSRYRRPVVIMNVDVVGTERTNRRFGRAAGDELLLAAARLLRSSLRDADLVARIGPDEFGVLMPETHPEAMEPIVARLHEAAASWRFSRPELRLELAIGWAAPEPFGGLERARHEALARIRLARPGA